MSNLQIECLAKTPISKEAIQVIWDLIGSRDNIEVLRTWLRNTCLSHERLRAELEGAEILLKEPERWKCKGCGAEFPMIPHSEGVEWCSQCATVQAQGGVIKKLRKNVKLLHEATIVLRNGMGGHNHWDSTQRHGAGCETCIQQQEARQSATRLIEQVQP